MNSVAELEYDRAKAVFAWSSALALGFILALWTIDFNGDIFTVIIFLLLIAWPLYGWHRLQSTHDILKKEFIKSKSKPKK